MLVEALGETLPLEQWAERAGIGAITLWRRLQRMPPEIAVTLPKHEHIDANARPGGPGSWTWSMLEWRKDPWAQEFVAKHPGGADLQQIADALGVTRQRVEQLHARALRKLANQGVELREWLGRGG